jgi:mono/diheme cytochrome c family protein
MKLKAILPLSVLFFVVFLALLWLFLPPSISGSLELSSSPEAIARGEYLVTAGGCQSCHRGEEDPTSLAGGHGLATDFGIFYTPNITPDQETGIGQWQAADFVAALKHGRTPSGSFYFPAFPYRAYGGLTDQDALDIGSYLKSLPPVSNQVPAPDTPVWLSRWAVAGWNLLADFSQQSLPEFDDEKMRRGAYLARHLGHCSECHTQAPPSAKKLSKPLTLRLWRTGVWITSTFFFSLV